MICKCCGKVKPDWGNHKYCRECWKEFFSENLERMDVEDIWEEKDEDDERDGDRNRRDEVYEYEREEEEEG
jgi:hypothetical protein